MLLQSEGILSLRGPLQKKACSPRGARAWHAGEEKACALALALNEDAARLNAECVSSCPNGGEQSVSLHMGIHGAVSVVGAVGKHGSKPIAQGEAPSLARRLQETARSGEVLLSRAMADTSRARFDVSLLEQARVGSAVGREVGVLHGVKALDERLVSESPHADREAAHWPVLAFEYPPED